MSEKILVIGSNGFIGSHLISKINNSKNDIICISKNKNKNKNKKIKYYKYDVFKNYKWMRYIKDKTTIYFLAFNNDLYELEKKIEYIDLINSFCNKLSNYIISRNLKVNLIFTSTVTIYGDNNIRINEKTLDNPSSNYDLAKLIFEKIMLKNSNSYLKFTSLRLSNIYGTNSTTKQKNRGFLNHMIKYASENKKITIFGKGKNLRNFLYIDDLMSALILTRKKFSKLSGKVLIVCNNQSNNYLECVKILKKINPTLKYSFVNNKKNRHSIENRNFVGSNKLFRKLTGWKPRFNLINGIEKTYKNTYK